MEAWSLRPDEIRAVRDEARSSKRLLRLSLPPYVGRTSPVCPSGRAFRRAYLANAASSEIHRLANQCPAPSALSAQTWVGTKSPVMRKAGTPGERYVHRDESCHPRVCVNPGVPPQRVERCFHPDEPADGLGFSRWLPQRASCKQAVAQNPLHYAATRLPCPAERSDEDGEEAWHQLQQTPRLASQPQENRAANLQHKAATAFPSELTPAGASQ